MNGFSRSGSDPDGSIQEMRCEIIAENGEVLDPINDGTDLNADGQTTVEGALWYYQYSESDAIRDNPELFDLDGDGVSGTVFDVVALFEQGD